MSRLDGLSQWESTVSTRLPTLQRSQATVLALWSFGMVLARSCGITSVAALLAPLLGAKEHTVRQRLREWCYAADDKRGKQWHELDVTTCFAPLLRWVLAWWPADERRLVLVMDASTLGQRFTVLAISVVYRGGAIPVAWTIVAATRKGAWRPHWEALFDHLDGSVPPIGPCWCWPIAASMRAGCSSTSSNGAGTRSCASTSAATCGQMAPRPFARWRPWCRTSAAPGADG